ncbi:MAG: hypothetical protein ACRDMH_13370 [Solirubrobacterales bacterium]
MRPPREEIHRRGRPLVVGALTLLALAVAPGAASASFHLNKIREVYPGTMAVPSSQYVELQMPVAGENFLHFGQMAYFDTSGNKIGTSSPTDVPSKSQGTILFATTTPILGVARDFPISFNSGKRLSPSGGAVCWTSVDCVSWGAFHNTSGTPLPSPAGSPAPAIPNGMALVRRISPGCPTLLEVSDDTNKSSADFATGSPHPRNTHTAPTERACPDTTITSGPSGMTRDRTPTFKFKSSLTPATFKCQLDGGALKACSSPDTLPRLSLGQHTFKVRATHAGSTDPTPASRTFKVVS